MDSLPVVKLIIYQIVKLTFHRIDGSSLGRNKTLAADSCKQIKEIGCHTINPKSGVYWVWKKQPMQVRSYIEQHYLFVITYLRFTVI